MRLALFSLMTTLCLCRTASAQVVLYPGDTNNDGTANHYDLLPVGVAYGMEGFPRQDDTTDWQAKLLFPPWIDFLPVSGINKGFVDCDGNGFIDDVDIEAIAANYDSVQNDAQPAPMPYFPKLIDTCFTCPKPDISITYSQNILMVEEGVFDTLYAYIVLRYPPGVPTQNGALGIAFDLEYDYDPDNIVDAQTEVFPDTFPDNRMYVIATSNAAQFWRLPAPGRMGFAAAGRGANVFFNSDTLFVIKFIIDDLIIRAEEKFSINISNVLIINNMEQVICFGEVKQEAVLIVSPVSEPWGSAAVVHLSPNPVGEVLTVDAPGSPLESVAIYSLAGEPMIRADAGGNTRFDLPVHALSPGMWVVVAHTRRGVVAKKIVKHP